MTTIPQLLLQNSPWGNLSGMFNGMTLTPSTGSTAGERSAIDYIALIMGALLILIGVIFLALSSRSVQQGVETGKKVAALAAA